MPVRYAVIAMETQKWVIMVNGPVTHENNATRADSMILIVPHHQIIKSYDENVHNNNVLVMYCMSSCNFLKFKGALHGRRD